MNAYTQRPGQKIEIIDLDEPAIMKLIDSEAGLRQYLGDGDLIGFATSDSFLEVAAALSADTFVLRYSQNNFEKTIEVTGFERTAEILKCYLAGTMQSVSEFKQPAPRKRRRLDWLFVGIAVSGILAFFVLGILKLTMALPLSSSKISAVGGFLMMCGLFLFWIAKGGITLGRGSIKYSERPFLYVFILLVCLLFMALCVFWFIA